MTATLGRFETAAPIALAVTFLVAFFLLGLHGRIEFGWGLGFGTFDLLAGAGLLIAAGWLPWVLLDDPREARILMLSVWALFGTIMLLSA